MCVEVQPTGIAQQQGAAKHFQTSARRELGPKSQRGSSERSGAKDCSEEAAREEVRLRIQDRASGQEAAEMSRSKFLDDRVSERGDELFGCCRGDDRVVFCREDEGWAAWTRGKKGFRFDRFELMAKRFFRVTLAPQGVPHRSDPARPPYDMGQVHTSDEIALWANPRVHRARSRRDYGPEACAENAHLTGLELGSRLDPVKRATHVPDALKNVLPELRWRRLDRQSSGWDAARRSAHVIR